MDSTDERLVLRQIDQARLRLNRRELNKAGENARTRYVERDSDLRRRGNDIFIYL